MQKMSFTAKRNLPNDEVNNLEKVQPDLEAKQNSTYFKCHYVTVDELTWSANVLVISEAFKAVSNYQVVPNTKRI